MFFDCSCGGAANSPLELKRARSAPSTLTGIFSFVCLFTYFPFVFAFFKSVHLLGQKSRLWIPSLEVPCSAAVQSPSVGRTVL